MRPVPEYDQKAWLLKALRETSHAMEALIWDADDMLLDDIGASAALGEEWSVRDVAAHMALMEQSFAERLEAIISLSVTQREVHIAAFDADKLEAPDHWAGLGPLELMEEFGAHRQRSVYLLWSLDEEDWELTGTHPYLGPLTVLQCAREMNEHDLSHLWQLRRLCDRAAAAV